MRFNMKTGLASQRKLSESAVDFPRMNESYTGRKQLYMYGTRLEGIGKITGIVTFDLYSKPESDKTRFEVGGIVQGLYDPGHDQYGSEPVFVPKVPGVTSEEDDGYLIFFAHDEKSGECFRFSQPFKKKTAIHVIDAKTMSSAPVVVVDLPSRVPLDFMPSLSQRNNCKSMQ